jgi:hypothetical protein
MYSAPNTSLLPIVYATANPKEIWSNVSVVSNGIISYVSNLTVVSKMLLSSALYATPSTISRKRLYRKYMEAGAITISVRLRCL